MRILFSFFKCFTNNFEKRNSVNAESLNDSLHSDTNDFDNHMNILSSQPSASPPSSPLLEATTTTDHFPTKRERLNSIYLFIITTCFLLVYLSNYIILNDKLSGLLFILTALVILTCLIFYYPSHLLNVSGYINLRILKWIYTLLGLAVFFYLLRVYTQACSSLIISASLGVKLFRELPFTFPNTFTFNELLLVVSMISNLVFTFIMNFSNIIPVKYVEVSVVQQAFVWLLVTVSCISNIKFARTSLIGLLLICTCVLLAQFIPVTGYLLNNKNPFIWLGSYLFLKSRKRVYLIIYWLMAFFSLGVIVFIQKQFKREANSPEEHHKFLTSIRKLFHMLICIVYILGFIHDRHLLYLCSNGMLILLILLETIRYHKIGVLGQLINDLMWLFVDEKDSSSKLVLSQIYLLLGLSYPLWISDYDQFNIAQLSGLLTVGIADSFASLIGSRFGKYKLFGTRKSIEGSLAFIWSQLIVFFVLIYYNLVTLNEWPNLILIVMSILLTCFVEAFTTDNDNLILPIIAYPFLCLASN